MKKKISVLLKLDVEEFSFLIKAIDFATCTSAMFEYGEHVEDCQNIRNQLMFHFKVNA